MSGTLVKDCGGHLLRSTWPPQSQVIISAEEDMTECTSCQRPLNVTRSPGYTLVEVLAAALLLSIALVAVLSAEQGARTAQRRAVYISAGRTIAQSKIDSLRAAPFDSLLSRAGTSQDSSLPKGNQIITSISRYPNSYERNMVKATVTVRWPEGRGTRTITYETLITRK